MNDASLPSFDDWWDYDEPEATGARFRALLPRAEAAGNDAYLAELLTQIARTEGLLRRFDDAEATLGRAESLIGPDAARPRVRLQLERGRLLNSSGRRDETRPHFIEAWEIARASGLDGLAVDAAHMLGIVEPPAEAVRWNETALSLAESSDDPDARRWRGSLCNNLGWTHHGRGDHVTALDFFERALEHRVAAGKPSDVRIARWCVARCLRSLDRVESALAIQRDLEPGAGDDGYVPEEIGECLLALGRDDEARVYFARAHALLSADVWFAEAEPERLARLARLGGVEPG